MKQSATITENKNGNLIYEMRATCEKQAPRGYNHDCDDEACDADSAVDAISLPTVGTTYMVATREWVGPNKNPAYPQIVFRPDNGHGWGGNSDQQVFRYHGWRGTTNDVALYGHGVRRCLVAETSGRRSRKLRIVFGNDLTGKQGGISAAAAELGRRGGSVKSAAKTKAVRENGRKGGRPRKVANINPSSLAGTQKRRSA